MGAYEEKKETCGTICLKYLLFAFNFLFWLAGGVVMAVGVWTLVEKSDYISLLSSKTYAASAYILVLAGAIVMVTGVLGCCATFKEQRKLLRVYFVLLLCIFLLEILAGVLAYIYYQQERGKDETEPECMLNEELKQNLRETMTQKYQQNTQEQITRAVDKLQQEFKCCGSNSSSDWAESVWIRSRDANGRMVPDSCCKTPTELCGRRDHPSNIYKVEGGCITKLEKFILDHLKIIGAVGVGIACVQIIGMVFTCCLYRSLKAEPY
uniref:Tetraspanin n=1 Tax=Sparus aurata TaxID=8175 RepID=A0A671TQQ9_SPAAU